MTEYGNEILAARSRRRITQGQLAKATALYPQSIVDIENNRLGVDEPTYRRLLAALEDCVETISIEEPGEELK